MKWKGIIVKLEVMVKGGAKKMNRGLVLPVELVEPPWRIADGG
jgi:hypothetical protein